MLKHVHLFLAILMSMSMMACAIQPYNHIDRDARAHFDSVESYLAVPQDEIYADIDRSQTSAVMGGGLLFALIDIAVDHSRTKDSEKLIGPLRDQMIDYDFAQILTTKINAKIKQISWLNSEDLVLERACDKDWMSAKYKASSTSAIMFMNADYKLSANFDAVTTRVNLLMFATIEELQKYREKNDNNENPVDREDNIYRNTFFATVPLGVNGEKEENANTLTSNGGSAVKTALHDSAVQIAEKIYNDILLDETADKKG